MTPPRRCQKWFDRLGYCRFALGHAGVCAPWPATWPEVADLDDDSGAVLERQEARDDELRQEEAT